MACIGGQSTAAAPSRRELRREGDVSSPSPGSSSTPFSVYAIHSFLRVTALRTRGIAGSGLAAGGALASRSGKPVRGW